MHPSKVMTSALKSTVVESSGAISMVLQSHTSSAGVGFIGLGIMGEGMAARLLSQGVAGSNERPLVIWNRTAAKSTALATQFPDKTIIIKESPCQVVEAASVTYSMMSTPEVSQLVFDGPDGVLAGVSPGKSIVDCATLAEADMKRMSEAVVAKGGRFLEAPVAGSKVPAAIGALIFLCSGSQELFKEVEGTGFAAMGKSSHFFGTEVGSGTRAKSVINSLLGTMMAAFGEALALSENVGLDTGKMLEVIGQSAIQSPVFALKGPKMLAKDHAPHFPLKHAQKDMVLACDMAKEAKVEFSVMGQAEQLFRTARDDVDLLLADQDFSAVYEKVHKESDAQISQNRLLGSTAK